MSKADKMFEELGYKVWTKDSEVVFTRDKYGIYDKIIIDILYGLVRFGPSSNMSKDEMRAIYLKLKELGWIE